MKTSSSSSSLCLLAALRGRGPFPVLIFTGEPGATKTTTVRRRCAPSSTPTAHPLVRSPPRTPQVTFMSRPTQDTCSASTTCPISQIWLSDAFCVVTEEQRPQISVRFTPTRMKACWFACAPLFLTGVTNIIVRGDAYAAHHVRGPHPGPQCTTSALPMRISTRC